MALHLMEYAWTQPRRPSEGTRVSCTRFLPRGVRKEDYAREDYFDVWLPALAPSRDLVKWAQTHDLSDRTRMTEFVRHYRHEMVHSDARHMIRTLAKLAEVTPISVGCSCKTPHCHRFELERLIRAAAAGKF